MKYSLRDYQAQDVEKLRAAYRQGFKAPLYTLPTAGGKCLGKDTPVLLYSGKIKKVQELKRSDILIGPDSEPRYIESLCKGKEQLYKIIPRRGAPFVCNKSHILSLKVTNIGNERVTAFGGKKYRAHQIVNISVLDYLKCSKNFKHVAKLWKSAVDFKPSSGKLFDPYFLGLWLGDGNSRTVEITNIDHEIINYLYKMAHRKNLIVNKKEYQDKTPIYAIRQKNYLKYGMKGGGNPILNFLKKHKLIKNKHIPSVYMRASQETRFKLLAGLIDSDGHYDGKLYEITQVNNRLAQDIVLLARSLGYFVSIRDKIINGAIYNKIIISGNLDKTPCLVKRKKAKPRKQIKNHLLSGFDIKKIHVGNYYGFELHGDDGLFMLGDFTVTHNTIVFCHIAEQAAARGHRIMIVVHRKELLDQAADKLTELETPHGLIAPGRVMTGDLVQVASVDTVIRRLARIPRPDIIIIDEAHHCIKGNKWGKVAAFFPDAYLLGVTATPCRTNGDGLGVQFQGYFDQLVCGPSIRELIDQGYLSQPVVYAPPIGIDMQGVKSRAGDYASDDLELRIDKSKITGDAVGHYKKICPHAPAIAFCVSIKHAANVAQQFNAAGVPSASLDGTMSNAQRSFRINALGNGQIKVLTSCEIVSEGTDIPIVTAAILLRPTKSLGMFLQQCGRILRIHPEKKESIILDHVNNTSRHGLVDEVRSWTLAEQEKQPGRGNGSDVDRVRQCKKCFAVFPISRPACPQCGEKWIVEERKIEQVDGVLKKLTPEEMAAIMHRKAERKTQGRAGSFDALQRLEKIRGYKPGWAKYIWEARQRKARQRQNNLY